MKKVLKWIGIIFAGLLAIIIIVLIGLNISTNTRLNKVYDVAPIEVNIPSDAAAIERGAYIYSTTCAGCHGENLEGTAFFDDPTIAYIPATNLTSGAGGIGSSYSDMDYVLAIQNGIAPDGTPLIIMPSEAFWYFSNEDLGALIAFLKSSPAVDNNLGERDVKFMGKVLLAIGAFGEVIYAEVIEHDQLPPEAPPRASTAEYGEYLITISHCIECHGENLNGGPSPEPGAPFSPNLTPGGVLATWSTEDFISTMRTGMTPLGHQLDKNFMPYEEVGRMTDEDLYAMFLFLQSLPTLATPMK
ncbi:MAG: cytochrome c [Anaerolineaceae bacterium]|nr:cytochrome c [Anaerolineaceae bacterium]